MAKLNTYVPVTDSSGTMQLFGPGDEVPDWAAALITNPHVWEESAVEAVEAATPTEEVAPVETLVETTEATEAPVEALVETVPAELLPIPAKGGPKATAEAWAAYAKQEIASRGLNVEIDTDASRTDIIEALVASGIPTE